MTQLISEYEEKESTGLNLSMQNEFQMLLLHGLLIRHSKISTLDHHVGHNI
jgi:hypothetical protein